MTSTRGWLYTIAKLMGDVSAVQKNRIPQRVGRRIVGRATARLLSGLFR